MTDARIMSNDKFQTSEGLPIQDAEHYIGDGLYVRFDGWQIWLWAPRENGDHEIALEPDAWQGLRAWLYRYPKLLKHMEPQW